MLLEVNQGFTSLNPVFGFEDATVYNTSIFASALYSALFFPQSSITLSNITINGGTEPSMVPSPAQVIASDSANITVSDVQLIHTNYSFIQANNGNISISNVFISNSVISSFAYFSGGNITISHLQSNESEIQSISIAICCQT